MPQTQRLCFNKQNALRYRSCVLYQKTVSQQSQASFGERIEWRQH